MQDEVKSADPGKSVAEDLALNDSLKMFFDALGRNVIFQYRIILDPVGDHRDVGCIAFVSSAGVGYFSELQD
jgi:hypothetical protein